MRVAVCVLAYNQRELLRECLESVQAYSPWDLPLVVGDNSTDENFVRWAAELCIDHNALHLPFRANLGTSAGWNRMVRATSTEAVAILNDDIRVERGWLRAIEDTLSDPAMGAMSLSLANGPDGYRARNPDDVDPMTCPLERHYAAYPCGCLLAMRREVFDRLGGFDEEFWIGLEEVDFGVRAWRAGLRCANVCAKPDDYKFARHWGGASAYGEDTAPPEAMARYLARRAYFERKHGFPFPIPQDVERELTRR